MKRKILSALLAAAMLCAMVPAAAQAADPVADALARYRVIVSQAGSYEFAGFIPTGEYRYALVQMEPGDTVPTLLLEQATTEYIYFTRVFKYSPESGRVIAPEETLMSGVAPVGGFRGTVDMQGDGNGICETTWWSGTGLADINRVTLAGDTLKRELQWTGNIFETPDELTTVSIDWHDIADTSALNSWSSGNPPAVQAYIYDVADPGAGTVLQPQLLTGVLDLSSEVDAVAKMFAGVTAGQRRTTTGADLVTLFAEEAAARAASMSAPGSDISISAAALHGMAQTAVSAAAAAEKVLAAGEVTVARHVSSTVTFVTSETGPVTVRIAPDILTAGCDRIRIQTPAYSLTFRVADLEPDLNGILAVTSEVTSYGTVRITLPGGPLTSPATLSIVSDSASPQDTAVFSQDTGLPVSSKYNPATGNMEGKVTRSGRYTVQTSQKNFTDIAGKPAEMQNAIRVLASKGIIAGTSDTTFNPDGTVSRAEIAKLIVCILGWEDSSAVSTFADVPANSWYSSVAAVSQQRGIISGYPDGTFRGAAPIPKDQIVTVCGRVLEKAMGYRVPDYPEMYLVVYSDTPAQWAQPMAALCTKENLVVQRQDGQFMGTENMTRGDAAVFLYRLYQRIW